jgi:hypothetical protein
MTGPTCPPVVCGDKLLIYYLGGNIGQGENYTARQSRTLSSGVATMPLGRFVAQRAGDRTGYLITREFILEGDTLLLNVLPCGMAYREAHIRVEVLRHPPLGEHADYWYKERGHTYAHDGFRFADCVPIKGDSVRTPVRWKDAKLGQLQGQAVYLRFAVKNMDLFSFQITNSGAATTA